MQKSKQISMIFGGLLVACIWMVGCSCDESRQPVSQSLGDHDAPTAKHNKQDTVEGGSSDMAESTDATSVDPLRQEILDTDLDSPDALTTDDFVEDQAENEPILSQSDIDKLNQAKAQQQQEVVADPRGVGDSGEQDEDDEESTGDEDFDENQESDDNSIDEEGLDIPPAEVVDQEEQVDSEDEEFENDDSDD